MSKNIMIMNIEAKKLEKIASYDEDRKFKLIVVLFLGFVSILMFFMTLLAIVYFRQKAQFIAFTVIASLSFLSLILIINPFLSLLKLSKWINFLLKKKDGEKLWNEHRQGNLSIKFNLFIGALVFNILNKGKTKISQNERKTIETTLFFQQ